VIKSKQKLRIKLRTTNNKDTLPIMKNQALRTKFVLNKNAINPIPMRFLPFLTITL